MSRTNTTFDQFEELQTKQKRIYSMLSVLESASETDIDSSLMKATLSTAAEYAHDCEQLTNALFIASFRSAKKDIK